MNGNGVVERAIGTWLKKQKVYHLMKHVPPEDVGKWAAEHMSDSRYDTDINKLFAFMLSQVDWAEVKNQLSAEVVMAEIDERV